MGQSTRRRRSTVVIAVDFDGTMHDIKHPVPGRKMGPPMPGLVPAIKRIKAAGHTIIVFTVRGNQPYIVEWLRYWGLVQFYDYDDITNIKGNFDLIIDNIPVRQFKNRPGEWFDIANSLAGGYLP